MARVMEPQRNAKRLPVRRLLARGAKADTQTGRALFDAQDDIDRRREELFVGMREYVLLNTFCWTGSDRTGAVESL